MDAAVMQLGRHESGNHVVMEGRGQVSRTTEACWEHKTITSEAGTVPPPLMADSGMTPNGLGAGCGLSGADVRGEVISTRGFRLRTRAPGTPLTIAAFGRGAVRAAARQADRMVINLVTPKLAARLVQMLHDECRASGRPVPPVAVWLATVIDPNEPGIEQLRRGLVSYMPAPGDGEMFAEARVGDVGRFARTRRIPASCLRRYPP